MNIKTRGGNVPTLFCFIAATGLVMSLGNSAHASSIAQMSTVARTTQLRAGDLRSGSLSSLEPMHIVVAVKLRNRDQLDSLVAAHETVTPAQFAAQFAPTQVQAQTVANYLSIMGFRNVVIAPNRLLVSADGVAYNAKAAFLTSFSRVQTLEGREAFANTTDAVVPAALKDTVLSVVGLQNVYRARTFSTRLPSIAATNVFGIVGHDPTEFQSIYEATSLPTAAGVTVGIIAVGDMTQPLIDLDAFTDSNGLPRVTTEVIYTGANSGYTEDDGEWALDSQTIVGMGGGRVGKLIFYADPDFSFPGLISNFNTAVAANSAKIINVSIGGCELNAESSGAAAATNQIFQVAAAQGQTFSISTGDFGADECHNGSTAASWPANSPFVVAVAGTTLNASTTTWNGEVVWNAMLNGKTGFGATGGSPSTYELKPSWQNGFVPGTKRGVADVAFDADAYSGAKIIVGGELQQWGGTSLSAPIFAGLWARVIAAKGTTIGFAAPHLYQLPAMDFHDVVSGNNGGFSANTGWDYASGRGSLIASRAIQHIGAASPLVANFSFSTNRRVVKFFDLSTDSAGAISSRVWAFGDGGTSTAINPSHIYLRAGTYNVTETVTDSTGWQISKTLPVSVGW